MSNLVKKNLGKSLILATIVVRVAFLTVPDLSELSIVRSSSSSKQKIVKHLKLVVL